jgi:hypothetical protein
MRNNDGTPATVDLHGAITTIGFMCELLKVLGVGDVPENTFWTARGLLEKYEEAIIAAEREACAKIAEQFATTTARLDGGAENSTAAAGMANVAAAIRARSA